MLVSAAQPLRNVVADIVSIGFYRLPSRDNVDRVDLLVFHTRAGADQEYRRLAALPTRPVQHKELERSLNALLEWYSPPKLQEDRRLVLGCLRSKP